MDSWQPLTEVARRKNIPESTARRYVLLFSDFIPQKKVGKTVLFAPSAGKILGLISALFAKGLKREQVEKILRKKVPQAIDVQLVGEETGAGRAGNGDGEVAERKKKLGEFLRTVVEQKKDMELIRQDFSLMRRELHDERVLRERLQHENDRFRKALRILAHHGKDTDASKERLKSENADLKSKLGVLESELVRLRKDRRELEKYLMAKIGKP